MFSEPLTSAKFLSDFYFVLFLFIGLAVLPSRQECIPRFPLSTNGLHQMREQLPSTSQQYRLVPENSSKISAKITQDHANKWAANTEEIKLGISKEHLLAKIASGGKKDMKRLLDAKGGKLSLESKLELNSIQQQSRSSLYPFPKMAEGQENNHSLVTSSDMTVCDGHRCSGHARHLKQAESTLADRPLVLITKDELYEEDTVTPSPSQPQELGSFSRSIVLITTTDTQDQERDTLPEPEIEPELDDTFETKTNSSKSVVLIVAAEVAQEDLDVDTSRQIEPAGEDMDVDGSKQIEPAEEDLVVDISRQIEPAGENLDVDASRQIEPAGEDMDVDGSKQIEPDEEGLVVDISRQTEPAGEDMDVDTNRQIDPAEEDMVVDINSQTEPAEEDLDVDPGRQTEPMEEYLDADGSKQIEPAEEDLVVDISRQIEPAGEDLNVDASRKIEPAGEDMNVDGSKQIELDEEDLVVDISRQTEPAGEDMDAGQIQQMEPAEEDLNAETSSQTEPMEEYLDADKSRQSEPASIPTIEGDVAIEESFSNNQSIQEPSVSVIPVLNPPAVEFFAPTVEVTRNIDDLPPENLSGTGVARKNLDNEARGDALVELHFEGIDYDTVKQQKHLEEEMQQFILSSIASYADLQEEDVAIVSIREGSVIVDTSIVLPNDEGSELLLENLSNNPDMVFSNSPFGIPKVSVTGGSVGNQFLQSVRGTIQNSSLEENNLEPVGSSLLPTHPKNAEHNTSMQNDGQAPRTEAFISSRDHTGYAVARLTFDWLNIIGDEARASSLRKTVTYVMAQANGTYQGRVDIVDFIPEELSTEVIVNVTMATGNDAYSFQSLFDVLDLEPPQPSWVFGEAFTYGEFLPPSVTFTEISNEEGTVFLLTSAGKTKTLVTSFILMLSVLLLGI